MGTDSATTVPGAGGAGADSGGAGADSGGAAADESATARMQARWFWRFWVGYTVSRAGDAVTLVALPLVAVLTLGASSFEVSLIPAAGFAAWIVIGLPAGVIVHRLPLRGVQVAMDLIRAAALLSIPVAAWLDALSLWQLVGVALLVSFATVVFDVGNSTLMPSLVDEQQLVARNSLISGSDSAVQLAGPAAGGFLVQALGAASSLLVDAVSYAVSAVLLWSLPRSPRQRDGQEDPQSTLSLIAVGLRFVVRHDVIRPCVVAATIVNFVCGGLMALTAVFLVRTLGATPGLVGVMIATEGLGSLAGATLTARTAKRIGTARAFRWAATLGAAAAALMPLASGGVGLLVFAAGNAGFAAGVVVVSILARTHRHVAVPRELLPRVMATVRFVSWGVVPFGALAAGLAASAVGNRTALWLLVAIALVNPVVLWLGPLRSRTSLED
jgi:MFS family permease